MHSQRKFPGEYLFGSRCIVLIGLILQAIGTAHALPALQLGPGDVSEWTYNTDTQTWETESNPFTLNAYANATRPEGGRGAYAWEAEGATDRYAYLIAAAEPNVGNVVDAFDITVGGTTFVESGYGTPPLEDPNSIAGHGIYDTYYEIYEFQFDGPLGTIYNTQPGDSGWGMGYTETFEITINSLMLGVLGIHFDLITLSGDGMWESLIDGDRKGVNRFAPWSHDAAALVPVPAAVWLFGTALVGLIAFSRRKRA